MELRRDWQQLPHGELSIQKARELIPGRQQAVEDLEAIPALPTLRRYASACWEL